jgi:CheY-like chemotaxis protein
VYDVEEGLWTVPMDKGQINQVIQNLILNADQSMPSGGTIRISCRNSTILQNEVADVAAGRYVRMEIADTGSGIDAGYINYIFDPYFSTKEKSNDKGSGLGLSIVHSIIKQHKGAIQVESSPGEGTVFTIFLPATDGPIKKEAETEAVIPAGKGLVLLMDDEETIHAVCRDMLAYLGYETLHAYNGEEAIAIYREHLHLGKKIDIVIMDLTIPGAMGGAVAVHKILELDQQAKVIVSSGYSDDPIVQKYREAGFVNIISKPYQLSDLSKVLSDTMSI